MVGQVPVEQRCQERSCAPAPGVAIKKPDRLAPTPPARLIEVIVLAFLTPSGRKAAAKVLRDAAASMHRLLRRRL